MAVLHHRRPLRQHQQLRQHQLPLQRCPHDAQLLPHPRRPLLPRAALVAVGVAAASGAACCGGEWCQAGEGLAGLHVELGLQALQQEQAWRNSTDTADGDTAGKDTAGESEASASALWGDRQLSKLGVATAGWGSQLSGASRVFCSLLTAMRTAHNAAASCKLSSSHACNSNLHTVWAWHGHNHTHLQASPMPHAPASLYMSSSSCWKAGSPAAAADAMRLRPLAPRQNSTGPLPSALPCAQVRQPSKSVPGVTPLAVHVCTVKTTKAQPGLFFSDLCCCHALSQRD